MQINFEYNPKDKTLQMNIAGELDDGIQDYIFGLIREETTNPIEQDNVQNIINKIIYNLK